MAAAVEELEEQARYSGTGTVLEWYSGLATGYLGYIVVSAYIADGQVPVPLS